MTVNVQSPPNDEVDPEELIFPSADRSVRVKTQLKKSNAKSNIWFFDSPKNEKRLTIVGERRFMQAVILEGDPDVTAYDVCPDAVNVNFEGRDIALRPAMQVFYADKSVEWLDFESLGHDGRPVKSKAQLQRSRYADQTGKYYKFVTDASFRKQLVLFNNWAMLCATITRCKDFSYAQMQRDVIDCVLQQGQTTLETLLECIEGDPALIQASVAHGLRQGIIKADLSKSLFGLNSPLRR